MTHSDDHSENFTNIANNLKKLDNILMIMHTVCVFVYFCG